MNRNLFINHLLILDTTFSYYIHLHRIPNNIFIHIPHQLTSALYELVKCYLI